MSRLGARADWEARIGRRSDAGEAAPGARRLPPPDGCARSPAPARSPCAGRRVEGAIGYRAFRAPSADGPWEPVDHGGHGRAHHPGPAYADTTGEPGAECWYAVASVAGEEDGPGELSEPVAARPVREPAAPLRAVGRRRRRRRAAGARVAHDRLRAAVAAAASADGIGEEFDEALRLARDELGADARPRPRDLPRRPRRWSARTARWTSPSSTASTTGCSRSGCARSSSCRSCRARWPRIRPRPCSSTAPASPCPPTGTRGRRWSARSPRTSSSATASTRSRTWGFEVWNEANLEVFWTGTQAEYFRLYETAVRAIKDVDERLLVGGPSTAASGWIPDFLDFVLDVGRAARLPLHPPLRQPAARRRARRCACAGSRASRCAGRSGA